MDLMCLMDFVDLMDFQLHLAYRVSDKRIWGLRQQLPRPEAAVNSTLPL
jgi:hypothetical protein